MGTRVSTKQKLLSHLDNIDSVLRDIVAMLSKRQVTLNIEPLVELLLEQDQQLKSILSDVEVHNELQCKCECLRSDCSKSDRQINTCQLQLKKSEILLSTALYYSRQKLDAMAKAVKNPVDMDELVRFSHRISATHGVSAPDNWIQGDPRRPYPNREEIRRGYLGDLDDHGQFRPALWEALAETAAAAASLTATSSGASGGLNVSTGSTAMATPTCSSNQMQHPPSGSGAPVGSHCMDSVSVSASPNMILPGVNMVSSPLTIPPLPNPNNWSGPANTELSSPLAPCPTRPPATSLAVMLEQPHNRPSLSNSQSSVARPAPTATIGPAVPIPGTAPMASSRTSHGFPRPQLSGARPACNTSLSGTSLPQPTGLTAQPSDTTSTVSPRASTTLQKRGRPRADDMETLTSDSSSDFSSADDS